MMNLDGDLDRLKRSGRDRDDATSTTMTTHIMVEEKDGAESPPHNDNVS